MPISYNIALVVVLVIGSQILHRHLSDKERRKNDVNFLKKWIFFLSYFIDFLKTTYLKKRKKKSAVMYFQSRKLVQFYTPCMYNTIVCIVFCTTSKTSIYSVSRRLTDFSVLDEAYFLPNSFYVDFPIEINVPHTQTIQLAVMYTMVLQRFAEFCPKSLKKQ